MSSNILTWDDVVPRRPGIDDLGGGAKENARGRNANPKTSLTAEDFNQLAKQVAAIVKTAVGIRVSVHINAGTPAVSGFESPTAIATGGLLVVDNGAGDTTIKWLKGRIPLQQTQPGLSINATTNFHGVVARFSDATYDGVRVVTFNATGVAADVDFTVET